MNHQTESETQMSMIGFYGFVAVVVLLFSISCARSPGGPSNSAAKQGGIETPNHPHAHLDSEEKLAMSDVLTDDGEEKLRFETINEAWGQFNQALELNPENQRAIFWREFLRPLLETKGLLARIRPLYMKNPDGLNRYTAVRRQLSIDVAPAFFDFLNDGPNDIDTDEKFLDWMDRAILSLDTLRTFIKNNKDKTYRLRVPEQLIASEKIENERDGSCAAMTFMTSTFTGCPANGMFSVQLNRADLEGLQYIVSRQMFEFSLLYAYRLSPTKLIEGQRGRQSTKGFLEGLLKGYDGNLLARNRIALAKSVLPDWIAAQRFVIENQDELCDSGKSRDRQSTGLCVQKGPINHEARNLELLETLMLGHPVQIDQSLLASPVKVHVMKIFNEPPASISSFFPVEYDEVGDPVRFNDRSYSPFFTEGSANTLWTAHRLEKKELSDKRKAAREESRRTSMGIRGSSGLASGEIRGFQYSTYGDGVSIQIESPIATLSASNVIVAKSEGDGLAKLVVSVNRAFTEPKEFFGREIVVNPESKTITVDAETTVTVIDMKTGVATVYPKTEGR